MPIGLLFFVNYKETSHVVREDFTQDSVEKACIVLLYYYILVFSRRTPDFTRKYRLKRTAWLKLLCKVVKLLK